MPFTFHKTEIAGPLLIEPKVFGDARGCFLETYKRDDFVAAGITEALVQDNVSCSTRGVLRGLHYQKHPAAQAKLVTALRGEIFDVAVDIRRHSPTYGRWVGATLSEQNRHLFYVPAGFAHGFCVLSEQAIVLYKTSANYAPAEERGVRWDDPSINISWPIREPVLSPRDLKLPFLAEADHNFTLV